MTQNHSQLKSNVIFKNILKQFYYPIVLKIFNEHEVVNLASVVPKVKRKRKRQRFQIRIAVGQVISEENNHTYC